MNSKVNLINAGKYLNRIYANMSMANYLKISPKMLYKYESGNYNFSLSQICDLCEKLKLKLNFSIAEIKK